MIVALAYGLPLLYAYCYVGKHSTDCYLAFADYLYQSNWMILPVELRRTFIFMIAHAQRPVYYHGYHVAILNFELFAKVNISFAFFKHFSAIIIIIIFFLILQMMNTIVRCYLMFKTCSEKLWTIETYSLRIYNHTLLHLFFSI